MFTYLGYKVIMLKFLLTITLFFSFIAYALEPEYLKITSGHFSKDIYYENYEMSDFDSINYYPMFKDYKVFKHRGIEILDVLDRNKIKLNKSDEIIFLNQSGDYTVGFTGEDIISGKAKISIASRDPKLSHDEKGNELIFDDEFKNTLPTQVRRRYGLWWVREMIIGNKAYPLNLKNIKLNYAKEYTAEILFPTPFGFSSFSNKSRHSKEILQEIVLIKKIKEFKLSFLNQSPKILQISSKYRYFLYGNKLNELNMKNGAYRLYVANLENGKITQFLDSYYYLSGIEALYHD